METTIMKTVFCAILLCVLAVPAFANNAAAVIDVGAGKCGVPNGAGGMAVATDAKIVATRSPNGNILVSCSVKIPDFTAAEGKAETLTDFPCGAMDPLFGLIMTFDSHAAISAKGNVQMKCRFRIGDY
jgi:hypothetical protein